MLETDSSNLSVIKGEGLQHIHIATGVKRILKLYLSRGIVTDGKTTRSKVESID